MRQDIAGNKWDFRQMRQMRVFVFDFLLYTPDWLFKLLSVRNGTVQLFLNKLEPLFYNVFWHNPVDETHCIIDDLRVLRQVHRADLCLLFFLIFLFFLRFLPIFKTFLFLVFSLHENILVLHLSFFIKLSLHQLEGYNSLSNQIERDLSFRLFNQNSCFDHLNVCKRLSMVQKLDKLVKVAKLTAGISLMNLALSRAANISLIFNSSLGKPKLSTTPFCLM